jgi:hypothetical protein
MAIKRRPPDSKGGEQSVCKDCTSGTKDVAAPWPSSGDEQGDERPARRQRRAPGGAGPPGLRCQALGCCADMDLVRGRG